MEVKHLEGSVTRILAEKRGMFCQEKQTGRGRRKSVDSYSEAELQLGGMLTIIHLLRTDQVEAAEGREDSVQSDADLIAEVVDPLFERQGSLSLTHNPYPAWTDKSARSL